MAREYAPIRLAIWLDDDFRALSPAAQHLYFVLLTSPSLSYCGVADWRPGRIVTNAAAWTVPQLRAAAGELIEGRFIVIDEGTEEVLVRSFVKHDGLMKNPKTAVSMAMAYAGTASPTLRGVIVHQLQKLHAAEPGLKGWEPEKVREVLARKAVDPMALEVDFDAGFGVDEPQDYPLGYPQGLPLGYPVEQPQGLPVELPPDQPVDFGERQGAGLGEGFLPTPAPAPLTSSIGGYVTGVPNVGDGAANDDPPPPKFHPGHETGYVDGCDDCAETYEAREAWLAGLVAATEPARHCPRHPGGTDTPCRECGEMRRHHERWHADRQRAAEERKRNVAAAQSAEARARADDRARAIANCDLCDETGYAGSRVCDHDPGTVDRARRGSAAVRAALAEKAAQRAAAAPPTPEPADDPDGPSSDQPAHQDHELETHPR